MQTTPPVPSLDAPHRQVDADRWEDIYAVGDVHGCLGALRDLLDRLAPGDDDLVVFVGDLVRKGPDSAGVLDLVRDRENFLSVRGNNEQKFLDGTEWAPWLTDDNRAYLESLPATIAWEETLVVHGGIDPRKPLADHSLRELLSMRSLVPGGNYDRPYWFERHPGPPRVFFGHTVLSEPFASEGAVGLDTGCVHGGRLTAYDVAAGRFVSVSPSRTHRERSADTIVDPHPSARQ